MSGSPAPGLLPYRNLADLQSPEAARANLRIPNDALVVTDHSAKADGKRGWFYAAWTNGTTGISMYSRQDTVTVSGSAVSFSGAVFGREFQEADVGSTLAIQGLTWGGGKPVTTINRLMAYNKVTTADTCDQTITSQANTKMIWPAVEAADVNKAIWIDLAGCFQFGYYLGTGLKPLVTTIASFTDAFNFAVSVNLGITSNAGPSPTISDASPTLIEWGTDNTAAIFTCGLLAVQSGRTKLWFPPGHYLATSISNNSSAVDVPGAMEAIGQCQWFGDGATLLATDTAGSRILKDVIPYDAGAPPPPPNGVAYGDLLSLRAATAPVVVGIGDSRGLASPNGITQGVAISEERIRMAALMRQNKKKSFKFIDRSIAGATWWDCASKANGVFPYWYTTTTNAWSTYYDTVDVGVGGASSVVTPDAYLTDQSGANDSWSIHPLPMTVVINHLAALTGSNSSLPPDILMMNTRPNSALQAVAGGGAFPEYSAFMQANEYSAMLTRSVALKAGLPFLDYHSRAMLATYGWDPSQMEITRVPDHAARTVTPTAPYRIRAASRDFRVLLKLFGANGAAVWGSNQKFRVQLSPRYDNYVEFSTDGSGYLTYRVVTYGIDTTATVTTTNGTKSLQVGNDGRTASGVTYTMSKLPVDMFGTGTLITRTGGTALSCVSTDIGSMCLIGGVINAAFDGGSLRTVVSDYFSANAILAPDSSTIGGSVTNTVVIGGVRFLPSDAAAKVDVVIGSQSPNKITGYTDANNVTLQNNNTVSYAGTSQSVFIGRLCIPTTSTGLQVGSDSGANPQIEISMTGTHLQCALLRAGDTVPIRFLSAHIERWGGKFYPTVRVTTGSVSISASGVYTDKRKFYRPIITPDQAFGSPVSSTNSDTGGDSGVHDGTPALMAIDLPVVNAAHLTA